MKGKLLYLSCAAAVLALCVLAGGRREEFDRGRVHRHQVWPVKEACSHEDGRFCTHLPLILIDTGGAAIPGLSREKAYALSAVKIIDSPSACNHLEDPPAVETMANVKYRGNSSLYFDKKSMLVKLIQKDGSDSSEAVMGMPAHSEWVLNGPFLDKTLIRNHLCMNVSARIMEYAPRVRFCEAFVNGAYQGVYVMMEKITIGEHRVKLSSYNGRDPFSSYLIRLDRGTVPEQELNNFSIYTDQIPLSEGNHRPVINVEYPSKPLLTPEIRRYIERDFSKFEKSLYSCDYNDARYGYDSFIDTDSFVNYFIINEFFQNYDAGIYSTYLHKDTRGKIVIGPVWDFNNACDNYMEKSMDGTGFELVQKVWYVRLFKDRDFVERIIARYRFLREPGNVLSEQYLMDEIDSTAAYLGAAVKRNYEVWGYSFDPEKLGEQNRLKPLERNVTGYDQSVSQLKGWIRIRGRWMDKNIEVLRQYCHPSKVKQVRAGER